VWAFLPPYMCDSSFERLVVPGAEFPGILPKSKQSGAYSAGLLPAGPKIEQIQRKIRVRGSTPENAPRIRAGMEKKEQKPELKKNQTRRCYAEKTSIFFQTTDRHPPGARRETTEVKTRKC